MKTKHLLATTALCAASTLLILPAAQAQTAPAAAPAASDSLPEVVVTARARPEKALAVPISVQNFSATKLAGDNIDDLNSLQFEAGFTFNSQGASYLGGGRQFPTLIFRGLSSNYGGAYGGSSGALFVDGIYISGGAASVTLADAAAVEVLKGPQNVYFGKNTFGGAINLITSNPSEDYHGKFSVGYSTMGSYDDTASVEGAIIPGLLTGRITGELMHQGPQYRAKDGGPLGEEDTKGVTAVLYATPTPDSWIRTRFHYSHDDDSAAADGFVGGAQYGTACPGMVNPYFCNGIPTLNNLSPQAVLNGTAIPKALQTAISENNFGGAHQRWLSKVPTITHAGLVRDNIQGSVAGGVKLPFDSTLQFSAGYNSAAALDISPADHSPSPFFITDTPTINRDFEADVRLVSSPSQPLRGVLGANFFESVNQLANGGSFFGYTFASFQAAADGTGLNESDKTEAFYGSLEYDILKNVTISGDLRYQRDTVADYVLGDHVSRSYNHALPRVIVKYEPQKGTNVYLSYSEGVQPPQLQTEYITYQQLVANGQPAYALNALKAAGAGSPYTPDPTNRVWEIGWKQALFDNRVQFSVDYYNMFWDHSLVNTFLFDPAGCNAKYLVNGNYATDKYPDCPYGSSGSSITNVSNDHIQGVEFDGSARLTPKFTVHAAFNWTYAIRTNYSDQSWGAAFTSGTVPNQDGNIVDLVPQYQASFDGTYKDHLIGPYDWYAHGVVNYTGAQYVEATDIAQIEGYYRVNVSAGITKGNLTFEAYVTNLLDDKNWDTAVRFPENPATFSFAESQQGVIASAPNPRNIGFKVSGKF